MITADSACALTGVSYRFLRAVLSDAASEGIAVEDVGACCFEVDSETAQVQRAPRADGVHNVENGSSLQTRCSCDLIALAQKYTQGKMVPRMEGLQLFSAPTVCISRPGRTTLLQEILGAVECWVEDLHDGPAERENELSCMYLWIEGLLGNIMDLADADACLQQVETQQEVEFDNGSLLLKIKQVGRMLLVLDPWQSPSSGRAMCLWEVYCSTVTGASLQIGMSKEVRDRLQTALITDYEDCFKHLIDIDLCCLARCDPKTELACIVMDTVQSTIGLLQMNEMLQLRLMNFVQETGLRLRDKLRDDPTNQEDVCRLQDSLARFLREKGLTKRAEQLYLDLRDACSELLGPMSAMTLQCLNQLAVTYQKMGNVQEACAIHRDLLSKRRETLGEEHADTLQTMSNLAVLLGNSEDPGDAALSRELYMHAVKGRRTIAPTNPSTFYTVSNFANLLSKWGDEADWRQAEDLHTEAVEALQGLVGAGHTLTLAAIHLQCEHRVRMAKALLRDACADMEIVVKGRREKLGKDHKDAQTSTSLSRVARYMQGALDATAVLDSRTVAASEGWRNTLEMVIPIINTAKTYRKCREQVRLMGTHKIRDELGAFVSSRGELTTSEVPFNMFARYAAGVEKLPPEVAEVQVLLGEHYQNSFLLLFPVKESAQHWATNDPSWMGQAAMSKNHAYLILKDLSWEWFNPAVFGMFDNLHEAIALLKQMKAAALDYCSQDKRWSNDIGLFVNVLTDINSFHLHIVDLSRTGPAFTVAANKNLSLDAVIKVLEEEFISMTGHKRESGDFVTKLCTEDDETSAAKIIETDLEKSLNEWPAAEPGFAGWLAGKSDSPTLWLQVAAVAVVLAFHSWTARAYVSQATQIGASLRMALCLMLGMCALCLTSDTRRLGAASVTCLVLWFVVGVVTDPYRAAKLSGTLQERGTLPFCKSVTEDCINDVLLHEVWLLGSLVGVLFASTVWLPISYMHSAAAAAVLLATFTGTSIITQAPIHSTLVDILLVALSLAFLDISRSRHAMLTSIEERRALAKIALNFEVDAETGMASTTLGVVFSILRSVSKLLTVAEPLSAFGPHFKVAMRALRRCRTLLVQRQSVDLAGILRDLSESQRQAAGEILEMLEGGAGDLFEPPGFVERSLILSEDGPSSASSSHTLENRYVAPAPALGTACETPETIGEILNIDFLRLAEESGNRAMTLGGTAVFNKYFTSKRICHGYVFGEFVEAINKQYMDNPYHNEAHGMDVANACMVLAQQTVVALPAHELFTLLIAALAHDVGHPGLNNNFFNAKKDHPLSMVYSSAILENYHVAMLNSTLLERNRDVSRNMDKEDRARFRSLATELILATDMARHFDLIKLYQSKRVDESTDFASAAWRRMQLSIIMKAADIGHSFKVWELHYAWSIRVQAEFFEQGDLERANVLHISPVCDRYTVKFAKGQLGFLTACVAPLAKEIMEHARQVAGEHLDKTVEALSQWEANAEKWKEEEDPPFQPALKARQEELTWSSFAASRRVQDSLHRAHLTSQESSFMDRRPSMM